MNVFATLHPIVQTEAVPSIHCAGQRVRKTSSETSQSHCTIRCDSQLLSADNEAATVENVTVGGSYMCDKSSEVTSKPKVILYSLSLKGRDQRLRYVHLLLATYWASGPYLESYVQPAWRAIVSALL